MENDHGNSATRVSSVTNANGTSSNALAGPLVVNLLSLRRSDEEELERFRESLIQFSAVILSLPEEEATTVQRNIVTIAGSLPTTSGTDTDDVLDGDNYLSMQRVHSNRLQLRISRVADSGGLDTQPTVNPSELHQASKVVLDVFEGICCTALDVLSGLFRCDLTSCAMEDGFQRGNAGRQARCCALLDVFGYPGSPDHAPLKEASPSQAECDSDMLQDIQVDGDLVIPCPSHVDPGLLTIVKDDLPGLEILMQEKKTAVDGRVAAQSAHASGSSKDQVLMDSGAIWHPVQLQSNQVALLLNRRFPLIIEALRAQPANEALKMTWWSKQCNRLRRVRHTVLRLCKRGNRVDLPSGININTEASGTGFEQPHRLRPCVHRVARDPRDGFRTSCTFEVHPNGQGNALINSYSFRNFRAKGGGDGRGLNNHSQ